MSKDQTLQRRFILYKGLKDLLVIYPVYTLLFNEAGISLPQISILLALWSLPVVLLELPSGILADRWSRRGMILFSTLLKSLCFLLWAIDQSFLFFALGFLCWGCSEAFSSGSEEALLFDSLKQSGREKQFESIYAMASSASGIAVAVSCFAGGYLVGVLGFKVVLMLSSLTSFAAFLLAFSFKEVNLFKEQQEPQKIAILHEACSYILKKRGVLAMAALLIVPIALAGILDEYDPLIAASYTLPITFVGFWVGGRYLLEGLGAVLAPRFGQRSVLLCLLSGLFLLVNSLLDMQYTLLFYFLFYLLLSSAAVIQENKIQMSIEEQGRSTVHSLISLAMNLHAILVFALLHLVDDLRIVRLAIALYCLASTLIIVLLGHSHKKGSADAEPSDA